jgi:hypothetical protein
MYGGRTRVIAYTLAREVDEIGPLQQVSKSVFCLACCLPCVTFTVPNKYVREEQIFVRGNRALASCHARIRGFTDA